MKVAIITILDNTNFGTYLQALATGMAIRSLGYEAEIVRYIRPFMTRKGYPIHILRERGVLSWLKHRKDIHEMEALRNMDYNFLNLFLPITKEYTCFEELSAEPPCADIYLTGSDQVWNSIYNKGIDKSFYLGFVPISAKKVAYAASIGMDDFPHDEIEQVKDLLSSYSSITVREKSAQNILYKIGIDSTVVLDPTLLLTSKQWKEIANKKPMSCDGKYLLIYSVERKTQNQLIEKYATKIAKDKGLNIWQVSYSGIRGKMSCADKYFGQATPDVFLNLMMNASFVIVSSFHGTAFAINFNKPFLTIAADRFNSRVLNLLELTCLQNRLIIDDKFISSELLDIDYTAVNLILEKEKSRSKRQLQDMLN